MDLDAEVNNEDTKRKNVQVFNDVSFDSGAIAVISGIAYFVMTQKTRLSLATVLKFFYLIILTFKESIILAIGNIAELHSQECGKYF